MVEETQETIWDKIADKWNEFRTHSHKDVEEFLDSCKGKVLDLGCGSGRNFKRVDKVKLTGVDFSNELLKHAKINAEKKKIDVRLVRAEVFNLPFENETFDAILFYAVLHCVDSEKNRKETLKEVYRILKSGKEVFLSTWGRGSKRVKNKEKEGVIKWILDSGEVTERYTYIYDKEEIETLAKEVGFEIVKSWEDKNINLILKK